MQTDKLYSIPKAAKLCGLNRVTFWKYVKADEIKTFKTPGGQYRIHINDLEAFIQKKNMYPFLQDPLQQKRVLIVDDDEKIRNLLKRALINSYELDFASDGFEAGLELLKFKPDLVILDLFMPKLDGFSVCRKIKTDAITKQIKVIAISGFDTRENRQKILDLGADYFLPKPLEIRELGNKIEKVLEKGTSS